MTGTVTITGRISPKTLSAGLLSGVFGKSKSFTDLVKGNLSAHSRTSILLPLKQLTQIRMIFSAYKKSLVRLLLFLVISFPLKLLLDVIFGLLYRNYSLIRPLEEYAGAAIITVFTLEVVLFFKKKLSNFIPWEQNPLRRLILEITVNTIIFAVLISSGSFLINYLILMVQFIRLSDEILKTVYYLIFLVQGPAFVEFAVFLLKRWRSSLAEMEKYKKENAEYKFETLRTQVNPHFLFNSLNTLSSLVYEDKDKAAGFIRDLSDVYRYVLDNRNRETIMLDDEIRFIRSFVYLYQIRFESKLNVEISITGNDKEAHIAPMTLQLLVENAVKHNIISTRKPLKILIKTDDAGYISVTNNLQKKTSETATSSMGLKNIKSRYSYLTNKPVEITETEEEFIVRVPLIR